MIRSDSVLVSSQTLTSGQSTRPSGCSNKPYPFRGAEVLPSCQLEKGQGWGDASPTLVPYGVGHPLLPLENCEPLIEVTVYADKRADCAKNSISS